MASEVQICNRALQKLGAKPITALDDDSANARSCALAYEPCRDAELRAHEWSCAIKRAELAASATAPLFGPENSFPLPSDFLRMASPDASCNSNADDRQVEGRAIVTNESGPLRIRYVFRLTDPNTMDALLREVIAARMAVEMCEEITQSNTKKASLKEDYKDAIRSARRANAFERAAQDPPTDTWETARA